MRGRPPPHSFVAHSRGMAGKAIVHEIVADLVAANGAHCANDGVMLTT